MNPINTIKWAQRVIPRRLSSTNRRHLSITATKEQLLQASLSHVNKHGWNQQAISKALIQQGLPVSMLGLVTPTELVEWFMKDANQKFAKQLDQLEFLNDNNDEIKSSMMKDTIVKAIRLRLEHVCDFRDRWHEGMALGATQNTVTTTSQLHEIVSLISQKVGLKGNTLYETAIGGTYVATELHLLADSSPNQTETWKFLDQRVSEWTSISSSSAGPLNRNTLVVASTVATSLSGAAVSLLQPSVQTLLGNLVPSSIMSSSSDKQRAPGTSAKDYDLPPFPKEEQESK